MKPHLFIGSSREGVDVARSIQENLENDAECSVWDQGLIDLNQVILPRLLKEVEKSDFGVFVCSDDDIAAIREKIYFVARDNVWFELGMFMAVLGQERTFFLIPQDASDLRLPSDLSGITSGKYDAKRRDGEWQQATGSFCTKVRRKIEASGFRRKARHERLDNLAVAYACCEWIPDKDPYDGIQRWNRKDQLFGEMVAECRREPPNKRWLAAYMLDAISVPELDYTASNIRVIAAIEALPQLPDIELLLRITIGRLTEGNARIKALDAARSVVEKFHKTEICNLTEWSKFPSDVQSVQAAQKRLRDSLKRTM